VRLLPWLRSAEVEHRGAMASSLRELVLELWCTICNRVSFYAPTTVERIEGKPVMRERLERPSTAVGKASGGAPSPRTPPAVEVLAGAPPPSDESAWEALTRWINGGGWLGGDGSVLGQICTG
jgi:hypothetical protein